MCGALTPLLVFSTAEAPMAKAIALGTTKCDERL